MSRVEKLFVLIVFCLAVKCRVYAQYNYKVFINHQGVEREFELKSELTQGITNDILTNSIYLNKKFLKQPKEIRQYLNTHENLKTILKLKTNENKDIYGELFDRNSDTLLVIGEGFPTPREQMVPFLALFPKYDVLFIDYQGQGLNHTPSTLIGRITYGLFDIDMKATKLGSCDEFDVINFVNKAKLMKGYKHCYALALCYSASIFVKSVIKNPSLFEKLIIDGCWPSIEGIMKQIAKNPSLICGKQPPNSPCPFITHTEFFQNFACSGVEKLTHIKLSEIGSIEDRLPFLRIPVLFFQSTKDCYCTLEQFENIWKKVGTDKIAVLTPHLHGKNYFNDSIIYQKIATIFFENQIQNCMQMLLDA